MAPKILPKSKPPRTKRAVEKPVDAEIKRAAERAGIPASVVERKMSRPELVERLCRDFGETLVLTSDLVAESLAAAHERNPGGGITENLREVHVALWKMRWELGLLPSDLRVPRKQLAKMALTVEAVSKAGAS